MLKNFTFQAMQLLYNEVAKGDDSFALGGNASATFKFGPLTTTPSFTLIDWGFPDAILNASAFATQATTSGNPAIPISGEGPGCATGSVLPSVPPCAIASNGMTNATIVDAKGQRHFLSGYEYADFILNSQLQTGLSRFPLNLMLEYENNLKAAQHPLDSKGNLITSIGSQDQAISEKSVSARSRTRMIFSLAMDSGAPARIPFWLLSPRANSARRPTSWSTASMLTGGSDRIPWLSTTHGSAGP